MRWLSPFHPSTAAVAGVAVHAWWQGHTYLCLAHHASLSFYTLDDDTPTPAGREAAPVCVRQVRLHARVLAIEAVRRAKGPDALLLLTDHPTPRLVRLEPRESWDVHAAHVWDLHLAGRTAAELGLGLATELPAADGAPGRWALAHVHTGQVRVVSLDTKQGFDARLDDVVLVASAVLARTPSTPAMVALLTISTAAASQGQPVLTFYTIDAARHTLRRVPWGDAEVVPIPEADAYGAHYLLALPANAGGGVLVFCEHSVFFVPPPPLAPRGGRAKPAAKRPRPSPPALQHSNLAHGGQVVTACVLPTRTRPVLYAMADGALFTMQGPAAETPFAVDRIAHGLPVPAGPHALTPLGDDVVVLASATGDSLLGVVDRTWHTIHTWPHAGPVLDLAMAAPAAGPAAPPRLLRACGAPPTHCLQLLSHALPTVLRTDGAAPGCMDLYACHATGPAGPRTIAFVVAYANEAHVYDAALLSQNVVAGRVVYAAGVGGHPLLVTRTHVVWQGMTWTPGAEIVAAYASGGHVLVGLHGGRLVLLHVNDTGLVLASEQVLGAEIACVWLGDEALVGLWDAAVVRLAVPALQIERTWTPVPSAVPSCVLLHAWAPDTPPGLVVGTVDGRVLVLDGDAVVHSLQLRGRRAQCEPCALDGLGLRGTGLLLASRSDAGLLYAVGGQWLYSPWPVRADALVRVYHPRQPALHCAVLTEARLEMHSVTGVQQDHVTTAALGAKAPTSVSLAAQHAVVALWDEDAGRGRIALYDRTSLARGADVALSPRERPSCVHVACMHGAEHVLIGTGFVLAAGAAPTAGRVLVGRLDGVRIELLGALDVPGHVLGVAYVSSYIVAAVDAQVHTYAWDAAKRHVRPIARWGCAFMASCVAAHGSTMVVGDAMHSLTVLHVEVDGTLRELARDLDPYWTTAVGVYDAAGQEYVGADIAMNLFVAQRLALPESATHEAWSHVMRRTTAFHYGDMINRIVRAGDGCVYVGAAAGGVGMLTDLTAHDAQVLGCLQEALASETHSVDGVPWTAWRTLRTDTREAPPLGVVDGEFVRGFLACDAAQRAHILAAARRLAHDAACRDALHETTLRSLLSRLP
ncbi:hypothetical protein MCAP1_001256 [Malassezia caprae]|uniref:DNA damage-binding protein 1 n=1 Tax=Malassezia caprae TaxID=1381934 RepID=A0AAF0IUU9_9BASI|nr:hypothetical protein MCAP1_001256 [Malassezia caprae]